MDSSPQSDYRNLLIGIGASAGGMTPIMEIVELLPMHFQGALMVAVHRSPAAPNLLANLLQKHTRLRVSEPIEGERLTCTHIYIARPSDVMTAEGTKMHLEFDREHIRSLERIDDLFVSIAASAGPNAVGVILSGMLWDGVKGLKAIKAAGGTCIVQSPEEASFASMPKHAIETVECDFIGSTLEIASYLVELAAGRQCQ